MSISDYERGYKAGYQEALQQALKIMANLNPDAPAHQELMSVDECEGCGPGGRYVRYCPIHGLHGVAPR